MSFGFGVGDIIAVGKIAKGLRERFVQAPAQYLHIKQVITLLGSALDDIQTVYVDIPDTQKQKLKNLTEKCEASLNEFEVKLDKSGPLEKISDKGKMRVIWARLTWDKKEIDEQHQQFRDLLHTLEDFQQTVTSQATFEIRDSLSEVKKIATDTHTGVSEVKTITKDTQKIVERVDEHGQRERSRQNLESTIQWLSPSDYSLQQVDLVSKRTKNTGTWFLESDEFRAWRNGPGQTLLCRGIPGTGKTYISCAAIAHLRQEFVDEPDVGVAFIYLNYQPNQGQSAREVLACVLRQLIQKAGIIPQNVDDGLSKDRELNAQPSLGAIMTALQLMLNHLSQTFVVVDALDECHSRDADELKKLLTELVKLQQSQPFCLLATSRDISSIETHLKPHSRLEIRAQSDDIIHYVNTRIPSLLESDIEDLDELQDIIRQKMLDATDGVFLLARFHMDYLMDQTSEAELENALGNINSGSDGLKNTYERTLERIRAQPSKKRELANRILGWLTHSYKALTISELREALAIEPGTIELNQRARPRLQMLDSVCAGLIKIDQNTGVIQLAHKTVKEYFDKTSRFPDAHRTIAETCLTYLSYDEFSNGMCPTEDSMIERLRDYPLYDYAAKYWAIHASISQCEDEHILSLLRHDGKISACEQALYGLSHNTSKTRGVHLAAVYGLQSVMSTLIEEGQLAECRDSIDRTPLHYAAEFGRTNVAETLLRTYRVNPNFTDRYKATALNLASLNDRVEVVRTLLEDDQTDPNIPNMVGWTPLLTAVLKGSLGVVEELLRVSRININCSTRSTGTALYIAANDGHEHICSRLLKQDGIDLTINKNGDSLLHKAASSGLSTIVQQLLKKDSIDINKRDSSGRTPLIRVLDGQLSTIRATETTKVLLDDHRIELNAIDKLGKSALMVAIHGGFIEAAQLILAQDRVDVNAKDNWGETAVMWAAEHGEADLIHALACHGVHFDVVNKKGQSALHYAVDGYRSKHAKGDDEQSRTVNLLLDKYGLEADREDSTGRAPISYAAECGNFLTTELLISKYKVDISRKDHVERTPFSYAAERGHGSILRLLLEAGFTGIDLEDKNGRSPLSYAADFQSWADHSEVILYLLSLGADINSKDGQGNTPLFYAVRQTNLENTKTLLEKGVLVTGEVMQIARYNKYIADSKSREVYRLVKEKELAQRS